MSSGREAAGSAASRDDWIRARAQQLAAEPLPAHPVVWDDTTNFMSIERGHVIDLDGDLFLVRSNEHEGRFGIDDQPKFWVKHAIRLETGAVYILKLHCEEEFRVHVGPLEIQCRRSAEKEARVLELVRGDTRFMQGRLARDSRSNPVRVIDFIQGVDLLNYLTSLRVHHEEYAHTLLPDILAKLAGSLAGIQRLHDAGLCHGDIRNDHLLMERETGEYKWIDFDLNEDSSKFDIWSAGNILHCAAAKGFVTFREAIEADPRLAGRLTDGDACVFFPNRVMSLRKVYPYLPDNLDKVLRRFSFGCVACYDTMSQLAEDLAECAESMMGTRGQP
jgi:tRNA A-37 threonylcarbamoyl transferase component Bud32